MTGIPIIERNLDDEDKEKFTSKDLTRRQFLFYIFEDFFRGMYLFCSVFFDLVVILPFVPVFNFSYFGMIYRYYFIGGINLFLPYSIILTGFLETTAIYYERRFWIKFFGKEATEKRYEIKNS